MSGIRIHHPTHKSCVILVPHPGDPKTGRKPKDYRINLDGEGDCIVSERVWQRLQEAKKAGLSLHSFIVLNEVKDPPALSIGFQEGTVRTPAVYKQIVGAIQEIAPPGVKVFVQPRVPRIGGSNGE